MSAPLKSPRLMAAGTPFGKYQLLDCIAESVMSKVYRARLNLGKMNRIVVLKTLHPRYLTDQKSRDQFHREIQTTMALAHSNIVQIHDFGEEEGCPFIVMEWVHGKNLRDITQAALAHTGRGIPPLIACYLIDQAAQGLDHAHGLKDKLTGESFNIVHRDLSPHNVIVGFDGTVKLIDFGIARFAHGDSDTLSDQIWGKAGYFSPEQAQGGRLDRRSDIFALGAVFFELLSGKKLFKGENIVTGLYKINTADTYVPKTLARLKGLPPALAEVMIKSMRVKREERYESAARFSKDVRKYMRSQPNPIDARIVSQFMLQLFPGDIEKDQARLRELSVELETALEAPTPAVQPTPETQPPEDFYSSVVPFPDQSKSYSVAPDNEGSIRRPPPNEGGVDRPVTPLIFARDISDDSKTDSDRLRQESRRAFNGEDSPEDTTGKRVRKARYGLILANLAALAAGAYGVYKLNQGVSVPVKPLPTPSAAVSNPTVNPPITNPPVKATPVRVHFHLVPEPNSRTTVLLDGESVTIEKGTLSVTPGETHKIEVRRPGFHPLVRELNSTEGAEVEMIPLISGSLSLTLDTESTAKVTNGRDLWVKKGTKLLFRLPPGSYRVYLSTEDGRERTIAVRIEDSVTTLASEQL